MSKKKQYLYAMRYTLTEYATSKAAAQEMFDILANEGYCMNGELVKIATREEVEEAARVLLAFREKHYSGKPGPVTKERAALRSHFNEQKRDFGEWWPHFYQAANILTQRS